MKKKGRRRRGRASWFERLFKRERERERAGKSIAARGESYANPEQWLLIERKKLASVPLENGILVIFHLLIDSWTRTTRLNPLSYLVI